MVDLRLLPTGAVVRRPGNSTEIDQRGRAWHPFSGTRGRVSEIVHRGRLSAAVHRRHQGLLEVAATVD